MADSRASLRLRARGLREEANELEAKAESMSDFEEWLKEFGSEDVVLFIKRKFPQGPQVYTHVAVRYRLERGWVWAVTGEGHHTKIPTDQVFDLVEDEWTTEVWVATEWERAKP